MANAFLAAERAELIRAAQRQEDSDQESEAYEKELTVDTDDQEKGGPSANDSESELSEYSKQRKRISDVLDREFSDDSYDDYDPRQDEKVSIAAEYFANTTACMTEAK